MELACPPLLPKTQLLASFQSGIPQVECIDRSGNLVLFPMDLTLPFARYVARQTIGNTSFKRYTMDRVYRPNDSGGQPRVSWECAFDIIHRSSIKVMAEAEVIACCLDALQQFPLGDSAEFHIRINNVCILDAILDKVQLPLAPHRNLIYNLMAQKPPSRWGRKEMAVQLNLSKRSLDDLSNYEISGELSVMLPVLRQILKESYTQEVRDAVLKLKALERVLKCMNVKQRIIFDPLLSDHAQYYRNELIFQIVKPSRKHAGKLIEINGKEILATGGRYDHLLQALQFPHKKAQRIRGVGFNMCKFQNSIHEDSYGSFIRMQITR